MKCEICGRGLAEAPILFRMNEKGVKGIWRCAPCGGVPKDDAIRDIVEALLCDD